MEVNFIFISFFMFFTSLVFAKNVNEICDLDTASGNCDSSFQRYHFNRATRKCERFTYTGCGGNANNFAYKFECERYCPGDLDLGDICSLGAEPGIPGTNISCLALIPKYYFNKQSGKCEEFTFGGCGGNHNNFNTVEECEGFCKKETNEICDLDKETGNCDSYIHRYYFDKDTRKCERFVYTGCGGNKNNFGYLYECERTCPGDLDIGDVCSLGPEPGIPGTEMMCMAYFPRYYYNEALGECDTFVFGGCGGNYNNFYTKEECESFCPAATQLPFDREECFTPPETGNCRAYMQRFYYDKDTEECKDFTYGGCGGSRNNFKTQEECVEKCGGEPGM